MSRRLGAMAAAMLAPAVSGCFTYQVARGPEPVALQRGVDSRYRMRLELKSGELLEVWAARLERDTLFGTVRTSASRLEQVAVPVANVENIEFMRLHGARTFVASLLWLPTVYVMALATFLAIISFTGYT